MPDRSHIPKSGLPPTWRDHILTHPGETALSLWWAVIGISVLLQPYIGFEPSKALSILPSAFLVGIGAAVGIGGVLTLTGLFWRGKVSTEWRLEKVGLLLGGAGWFSYGLTVAILIPHGSFITTSLSAAMTFAAAFRVIALRKIEKEIRARLENHTNGE